MPYRPSEDSRRRRLRHRPREDIDCNRTRYHARKLVGELDKLVLEALSRRCRKHDYLFRAVDEGNTYFKTNEQVTLDQQEASFLSRWQSNPHGRRWLDEKVIRNPISSMGCELRNEREKMQKCKTRATTRIAL